MSKPARLALLFMALSTLMPAAASAGVLSCQFTEPFLTIAFDSATGVVTFASPDEIDVDTGKIVPRVIAEGAKLTRSDAWVGYPTLTLDAADGKRILEIRMNGQGSDGMSESVFPMEGVHEARVGGCESTKAPAYNLYDFYEDLGIEP